MNDRRPLSSFASRNAMNLTLLAVASTCVSLLNPAHGQVPDTLALSDAISIARENNLGILRSGESVHAAQAGERRAHAERRLPRLDLSVTTSGDESPLSVYDTLGARYRIPQSATTIDGSLVLTQPLPLDARVDVNATGYQRDQTLEGLVTPDMEGTVEARVSVPVFDRSGSVRDAHRHSEWALGRARLAHEAALADLDLSVTRSYYSLVRSLGQLEIQRQSARESKEQAVTARLKLNAGLIAEGDALQLEVARDLVEADLVTSKGNVERARDQLGNILGLEASRDWEVDRDIPPIFEGSIDAEEALSGALARRTELRDADLDIASQRLNVETARSAGGVNGAVEASYGLRGTGADVQSAYDDRGRERAFRVALNLPLWDSWDRKRLVDISKAALATSELSREEIRRGIILDVRETLRALDEAQARAAVLDRAATAARRAYEMATQRFAGGMIDSQRLLQEQTALYQAQSNRLNARIDVHLAWAEMKRALLGPVPIAEQRN